MPMRNFFKAFAALTALQCLKPASAQSNQPNCSHPTAFLQQQVDPSTNSRETFGQQYQVIDDYFKPGGPILFYQGAETAVFACIVSLCLKRVKIAAVLTQRQEESIIPSWAKELGALAVSLEHRFFGASFPSNASDPAEQYETLTLDNVMLDSVRFIQHVKNTTTGVTQSTPVIILGSSYGGFLSQVIRLNHPGTFFGSVAWAAPVRGFGPDQGNPDRFNWMNHVSDVYLDESATAAQKIKSALQEFDIKSSDPSTLPEDIVSELSICTQPTNQTEYRSLLSWLVTTYSDATQYSLKTPLVLPVDAFPKLVNATETASNASGILNAAVQIKTPPNANCTDWTSQGSIDALANIESYLALICKYYPNTGSNEISNTTIFPASVSQSFADILGPVCPSTYNVSISSILTQEAVQTKYHFTQADIEASQRILFPMGEWDPVGSIGPKPFNYPGTPKYTDRNASRAWVVNMMSHGEDSLAPVEGDKESVVHARNVELQGIKEWLGL